MTDKSRTNKALLGENSLLKQGIRELDQSAVERKWANDKLTTSEKRLCDLNELQGLLLQTNPIEQKLKLVTEAVVRIVGADFARIWMIIPGDRCEAGCIHAQVAEGPHACRFRDRCLHLIASSGRYTHTDGRDHSRVPFGCYKIGKIAAEKESHFLTNEVTSDPRVHNHMWAKELGLMSFAGYRLVDTSGTPNGVLALFSKQAITAGEDALLQGIADATSQVLQSALSEEALRESEDKFRTIFDKAVDGILIVDALTKKFLQGNATICSMLGYTREEIESLAVYDIHPPQDISHILDEFEKQAKGEKGLAEDLPVLRKDRSIFYADIGASAVIIGGVPFLVCIFRDITERKRAEETVQRANVQLLTIIDNLPFLAWLKDSEGRFMAVNEPFARSCGLSSANDLVGKTDLDIWPKPLAEAYRADDLEVMRTRQKKSVEELISDQGVQKWFETYKAPLREVNGNIIGTTGFSRDITERKQAEEQIRETLDRLRRAVDTTIQVVASAVETRDPYTAGHQIRSADLARAIATEMGLSQEKIEGIRIASSIHDVGKIAIPAEILSKPTKLSELEFSLIKEHARKGYEILKDVESPWPLAEIVYQHQERMDGSGYPRNLKGDDILIEARILAVADVVEAMASHRPYRPALGLNAALEEIEKNRGILYDDAVADACLTLFREKGFELERT